MTLDQSSLLLMDWMWSAIPRQGLLLARHRLASFRGLGDALAWALARVGVQARDACGCDRRQKWLNRKFPFRFSGKPWGGGQEAILVVQLENRTDQPLSGTLQHQSGLTATALARFVDLPPGASIPALARVTAHPRRADRWSIQLTPGAGPPLSGHVSCAIPAAAVSPIYLIVASDPAPRLLIRINDGGCDLPLR